MWELPLNLGQKYLKKKKPKTYYIPKIDEIFFLLF